MFEPKHSRPRPKGEEGIWNVFVTKGDCGPYKPLDGFNMAAIRNKITEFYSVRTASFPILRILHQELTNDLNK